MSSNSSEFFNENVDDIINEFKQETAGDEPPEPVCEAPSSDAAPPDGGGSGGGEDDNNGDNNGGDNGDGEPPSQEPGQPEQKPQKGLARFGKKAKIIIGAAAAFVLIIVGLGVYMFGELSFDRDVHNMTSEELGAANTGAIIRGDTEPSASEPQASATVAVTGQPEESAEPSPSASEPAPQASGYTSVETDPDDPAVGITELPEDVQVAIGQVGYSATSNYTTSYLKPGYDQIQTFVCYGLDEIGISDAIILVTLDPIHHKIKLTNIARDTYVRYADEGYSSKINHGFRWGGAAYAIQTLNDNFSLSIQDYISIDFDHMEDLIDFFGGVDVDVDYAEWRFMNNPAIEIGHTTLDGKFGLKYCRIRTIDSDLVRQSRQQEVLLSMYNKAREISPTYYPALIRQVAKLTTTSFDVTDLISMSDILLDEDLTLEMHSIPGDGTIDAWGGTIYGGWYYIYNLDDASDYIYKIIYEDYYISGYDTEAVDAYEKENHLGKYAEEGAESSSEETATTVRGING